MLNIKLLTVLSLGRGIGIEENIKDRFLFQTFLKLKKNLTMSTFNHQKCFKRVT